MKPFCLAPFVHSHIDVDGSNKLCCIARNDLIEEKFRSDTTLSAEEFWKSEYLKDRREKMLQGTPPPECQLCITSNRVATYKDHFNDHYENKCDLQAEAPVDLDIRIPVCNLKCRTCGPGYSTAIANHFQKNRALLEENGIYVPVENREMRIRTNESFNLFVKSGKIEKVYFAGGEPTAAPEHLSQLNLLLQHNKNVQIGYNTNLSMRKEFLESWIPVLKKFSAVNIQCSLDGVNEIGEYIREGLNFRQFDENLTHLLKQRDEKINVMIDLTLTSLGLLDIIPFAKFALSKKVFVTCKFMVGGPATFLRSEYLTAIQRKKITEKFNAFYASISDEDKKCLSHLYELVNRLESLPHMTAPERADADSKISVYDRLYSDKPSYSGFLESKDI